jgi:glucosamine 6-phosphate synthetase-like amidotransferase/phosphosugar isomerase protein
LILVPLVLGVVETNPETDCVKQEILNVLKHYRSSIPGFETDTQFIEKNSKGTEHNIEISNLHQCTKTIFHVVDHLRARTFQNYKQKSKKKVVSHFEILLDSIDQRLLINASLNVGDNAR